MNSKIYKLPNGKKAVFEYDTCGIGKITLECMDELIGMIADRPQGEWLATDYYDEWYGLTYKCNICGSEAIGGCDNFCPHCGARMKGADDE